jgi:polyphenol oxidase
VGGLQILEAPALQCLDWLVHGYSTRSSGASRSPSGKRILSNRREFFHAIGATRMRAAGIEQIHSDIARRVDLPIPPNSQSAKGDALLTADRGVLLVVQAADCVPILLADTRRRAVAAIHSGWRGTLLRIAAKTVGKMRMEFGTSPHDLVAAIGPSIGRCCYEVGSEVAMAFHSQFANAREWFSGPFDSLAAGENDPNWLPWLTMMPPGHQSPAPRIHLDLLAANRAILADAGVPAARIYSSGFCTACRSDLFLSYRREHTTDRMMAAIGIRRYQPLQAR